MRSLRLYLLLGEYRIPFERMWGLPGAFTSSLLPSGWRAGDRWKHVILSDMWSDSDQPRGFAFRRLQELLDDTIRRTLRNEAAGLQPDRLVAHLANLLEAVADEDDCRTGSPKLPNPLQTLPLKRRVADGEDFVNKQNLGLNLRGDGEPQAHRHAIAVNPQGTVDKLFHFGEGDDVIEL